MTAQPAPTPDESIAWMAEPVVALAGSADLDELIDAADDAALAELEAEAEAADGPFANRWRDARTDEKLRYLPDAAATRARVAAQEAAAARPLTDEEEAFVDLVASVGRERVAIEHGYLEPEDRGQAVLSELGQAEYVEDLVRPGRIVVVAAEEGTGKSYAITGELGIRVAVAGGSFAGTWPILATGPVLVMSEMHPDDDYAREAAILEALELDRSALARRYFRLPLMTAAGAEPALLADAWLEWITAWLRDRGALLLVIDTATGASQVDPWGRDIQAVYRRIRAMLDAHPALAVVLIVHLKKPQGNGERRLSDVLGEWGRWCDVVLLLEHDGTRTKLTTRKRIRRERRIAATKAGGLLVDPIDLDETGGTKVAPEAVLAAIAARPGMSYAELGAELEVSKDTAGRYVKALGARVDAAPTGPRGAIRLYAVDESTDAPPQTAAGTGYGGAASDRAADPPHRRIASIDAAVPAAVVPDDAPGWANPCHDYPAHVDAHRLVDGLWVCEICAAAAS